MDTASHNPSSAQEDHLHAVVERAYTTFARYEEVSDFVGCACGTCVSEEENAAIHAKPLRELAADDLSPLMSSASVATHDLKHFLPRILEWIASGEPAGWKVDYHFAVAPLSHYGPDWTTWPPEEQAVVLDFLEAWWKAVLQRQPNDLHLLEDGDAEDVLSVVAQVVDDVTPYLVVWEQAATVPALKHLGRMATSNLQEVALEGRLQDAFLQKTEGAERTIREWLLSPAREEGVRALRARLTDLDPQADAAIEETAHALAEVRRVAVDLDYFLDEYWGRRFEDFAGQITGLLSRQAAAARVNPDAGLWNRRPREMRRVLDWLSEPGRTEGMRRVATERGWHPDALSGLREMPMLHRVLEGELRHE